jgi:hypothetical protein
MSGTLGAARAAGRVGGDEVTIRKIAIDPGFYAIKVAEVLDPTRPRPDVSTVQAVVGLGSTDVGLLEMGLTRRRTARPHVVSFGDMEYLVGPEVARFARPIERMDFNRLGDSPGIRASIYAALYAIADGGECDLAVVAGLPVEVLQGQQARETVNALRGWLEGEHHFSVDGRQAHFTVHEVKVLAQPQGALFEWALNMRGQWAHPTATVRARIAVFDLGFNTLDLLTIEDGRISKRFTGGDTVGMRRTATALADVLANRGRAVSLHEADGWVRRYVRSRRREIETNVGGEVIDLKPLIQRALESTTEEVLAFVERVWGNGRQFRHIILTGGGALAVSDALLRQIPHATLLPDAVTANARGLARFAQRPRTFRKIE